MERRIGNDQTVRTTVFQAGSYTVLKEVITDHYLNNKVRTWYRLQLERDELERMPQRRLLVATKHYPRLSTLCKAMGIDPAKAAFPTGDRWASATAHQALNA